MPDNFESDSEGLIGCFSVEGTVGSVEVVEVLPLIEFCLQIDIAFVAEQLVKFLAVGSV